MGRLDTGMAATDNDYIKFSNKHREKLTLTCVRVT